MVCVVHVIRGQCVRKNFQFVWLTIREHYIDSVLGSKWILWSMGQFMVCAVHVIRGPLDL